MTEAEWLAGNHPYGGLDHVKRVATDRQRRLFACGCCRHIWPLIDPEFHEAVEVGEAFADGQVFEKARKSLFKRLSARYQQSWGKSEASREAAYAAVQCLQKGVGWHPASHHAAADAAVRNMIGGGQDDTEATEYAIQAHLLRCIFGNPFRPVEFKSAWRSETAAALASGIYSERAFDRMPILADALEEVGCDHADVLAHCRAPGPHARGCWVVDLVLGKE